MHRASIFVIFIIAGCVSAQASMPKEAQSKIWPFGSKKFIQLLVVSNLFLYF